MCISEPVHCSNHCDSSYLLNYQVVNALSLVKSKSFFFQPHTAGYQGNISLAIRMTFIFSFTFRFLKNSLNDLIFILAHCHFDLFSKQRMNGNTEQAIKMTFFFLFQGRFSFWLKEASSLVSQSIDLKLKLPMTREFYLFYY